MNTGNTPEEKREFWGTTMASIMCNTGTVIGNAGAYLMMKHVVFSALSIIGIVLLSLGIGVDFSKGLDVRWRKMNVTFHLIFLVLTIFCNVMALSFMVIASKNLASRERKYEYQGQISLLNYPGWYGHAEFEDTALVIASFADESPLAKLLGSNRTMNVSVAQVVVVNRSAENSVLVDTAKATLTLEDGRTVQCLPPAKVLGSYKDNADKMTNEYLGPHSLGPSSQSLNSLIYLPLGFPWTEVTSVTVHIDGKPVMIQGRVLTVANKAELVEERRKANERTFPCFASAETGQTPDIG